MYMQNFQREMGEQVVNTTHEINTSHIDRYASKPHMSKSVIVQETQKTVFNSRNWVYLSKT